MMNSTVSEHTQEITIRGPSKPTIDRTPTRFAGGDYALYAEIDGKSVIVGEAFAEVAIGVLAPAWENAKLWAAAPEMVRELEWMAAQYDDSQNATTLSDRLYDVSCTARKLLLMVKGEQS